MLKSLRLLLVWLALAGLPLQGFAAATMAFCKHGAPDGSARAAATLADQEDSHVGHEKPADAQPACGDCSPCHLCGAFALPAVNAVIPQDAAFVYLTRLTLQPDGHLPDQPKRPPLA